MNKSYPKPAEYLVTIQSLFPPDTPTLRDVLALLQDNQELSSTRKRDFASALQRIARALHLSPEEVPADPVWLQKRLSQIVPAQLGIAKKTWSNVASNALAALASAGIVRHQFRRMELNEAWQGLWNRLERLGWRKRATLGRFFRFCSNNKIQPCDVTNVTLARFKVALISASLRKRPELAIYQIARAWNLARSRIAGWPTEELVLPTRRVAIMPVGKKIANSFERDLEKYLASLACADPLDAKAPSRPRATSTLNHRRVQLRRFAADLIASGLPPEDVADLRAMVQPDVVRRGLRRMLDRKGGTITSTMWILVSVLTSIARNYVEVPAPELTKLQDLCRRLAPKQRGMTVKNRSRLRQFDDPSSVQLILNLPYQLLKESKDTGKSRKRAAVLVETALAIELLLMCMPRIKNVARIHLDDNLHWARATRAGGCHLVFGPSEVKNEQHLEFDLNPQTVELLKHYIKCHRSDLAPATCRWLFGTRDGSDHVDECVLAQRIRSTILSRTGLVMNPHLFRSLGARAGAWRPVNPVDDDHLFRSIRDVLRLSAAGLSKRQIAASLGIGPTAAGACLRRAQRAGIAWPLPDDLDDDALERRLWTPGDRFPMDGEEDGAP